MSRKAKLVRKTKETDLYIVLTIDGKGMQIINTPINSLNHMLEQFSKHGLFDLSIKAAGDIKVDDHHIVEDIGIVLGEAFSKALGDKCGINRYGFFILPMDESLASVAIDFSGRYSFRFDCQFQREKLGDLSTEIVKHFWDSFAQNAKANVFIKVEYGENDHHKVEAIFKAMARAIQMACEINSRAKDQIPSTKGKL